MKKRKFFLIISGVAICFTLLFVIRFFSDNSFRDQLPGYPNLDNIPKSFKQQIIIADRKANLIPTANNLGKLGLVYHSSAYYEKANKCYQLAVNKNSDKWIWSYYLGYLNLEMGNSDMALKNFNHVITKEPNNNLALFYIGEIYQNLGLIEKAENIFKQIISIIEPIPNKKNTVRANFFPLQTYASYNLARIYINSNRIDIAENTLLKIIDEQITFGPAYRLLSNLYDLKGNSNLSDKYNVLANDLTAYTPPVDILVDNIALISRSDQYLLKPIEEAFRNLNFKWGLRLCNQGLKHIPHSKYLISNTITGYLLTGDGENALPYLDQHIKYFSDDFTELMSIADLLYNNDFQSQAMKYFNQAKKIKSEDSKLAIWLSNRGMIDDAIILLNDQLKKDPENKQVLLDAVHLLMNLGEDTMAMKYFNYLKLIHPSSPEAKILTGMIKEKEGNIKDALFIFEDIFINDPKDMNIMKYLANFYIRNKMWDKAINHFMLSLNNNPNDPFLLEGLGRLLLFCPDQKFRDMTNGIEYSKRAFINFRSPLQTKISAGKNLATTYAILGNREKSYTFMNHTVNLARRMNLPKEQLIPLENMLKEYSVASL